ncbi:MAG: hypothetical protein QM775_05680 [Pirellulales bacterium]
MRIACSTGVRKAIGIIVTFHLVLLTWVFFRASSFADAVGYLRGILQRRDTAAAIVLPTEVLIVIGSALTLLLLVDLPQYLGAVISRCCEATS